MPQKNSSRRSFVKTTAGAAAGFMIVPRFVLGRGYTAPSDMLNIGFIGTGKQARGLMGNFRDKANIVAGADVDLNKLHYFHSLLEKYYTQARKDGKNSSFKGFTGYDDYREILYAPGINGTANNSVTYTSGSTAYNSFRTFAIKIVMSGTSTVDVPKVRDFRAIALPEGS